MHNPTFGGYRDYTIYDIIFKLMSRLILTASTFLAFASTFLCVRAETNHLIRNAAELAAALETKRIGASFDITATVTFPCNPICCTFAVEDETGAVTMREDFFFPQCPMKAGDRVRLIGGTAYYEDSGTVYAPDNTAEILSHGPAPIPTDTSIDELTTGKLANRLVRFKGTVRDAFVDEIDPLWGYLVVQDSINSIYATFATPTQQIATLHALIGAKVQLSGLHAPYIVGSRQTDGMQILMTGLDAIEILKPAPKDPFDVPLLGKMRRSRAALISGMERRRVAGRVIAVWHGDRVLLQTSDKHIVRIDLAERNPPEYGTDIEAVGNPETDLYRLNLSRAIWQQNPSPSSNPCPPQKPETVSISQLLTDRQGRAAVQVRYHGQPIRIRGVVRSLPAPGHPYDRLGLECESRIVPIDASACPAALNGVEIGCVMEASGICLIETENWRPNEPFPHIEGFAVIVRTPSDVRILSRPPWWTTKRLMAVIGALLAALAGIFIWNRSLNQLAERRGRELTEESIAHIAADMKVGERTRLAIELHDALSQNLTGVSLEIATASKFAAMPLTPTTQSATLQHLDIATRSLKSCRDELRNCIWDLRNCALEATDMNDAVRRTLAPFVNGVELVVRFNVPRNILPDNTTPFLRIVRELTQNAIRHGHAKTVRIAGCLENDRLLFSVADDGSGFDTQNCPNVQQGHFGLQGIRERVNQFGGEMSIKSEIGNGTKVTIAILMKDINQSGEMA